MFLLIGGLFLLIAVAVIVFFLFFKDKEKEKEKEPEEQSYTQIVIEINPKILLEIDSQGYVVNVYPLNSDANIFTEDLLKGKNIVEATKSVVETAKNNGYLVDNELKVYVMDNKKDEIYTKVVTEIAKIGITPIEEIMTESVQKEIDTKVEEIKNILPNEPGVEPIIEEQVPISATTYVITFDSNGGSKVASKTVKAGETVSKPTNPKKSGYDFVTWKLNGKKYNFASTINENITLVAEWTAISYNYDYNLNDNLTFTEKFESDQYYVYPHAEECKNQDPYSIVIPDGQNYDTYCQNIIPDLKDTVKGKGYVCTLKEDNFEDFKTSGTYRCYVLAEIVSMDTVKSKIKSMKVNDYAMAMGGGTGDTQQVTLTEELCTKYSLNCGRK